eukprot:7041925-Prymnesium_polylepis.1
MNKPSDFLDSNTKTCFGWQTRRCEVSTTALMRSQEQSSKSATLVARKQQSLSIECFSCCSSRTRSPGNSCVIVSYLSRRNRKSSHPVLNGQTELGDCDPGWSSTCAPNVSPGPRSIYVCSSAPNPSPLSQDPRIIKKALFAAPNSTGSTTLGRPLWLAEVTADSRREPLKEVRRDALDWPRGPA